jgi:hypothetical protein
MHEAEIQSMSELPIVLGNFDLHESNEPCIKQPS